MLRPLSALVIVLGASLMGGWLSFALMAHLDGSSVDWLKPWRTTLEKDRIFDITRSTATLLALFGGLFAVVYAYRKQRVEEASGHRSDAEALSKRYQDAAEQLGHDQAAVRLAGAYSMARLADEWPEQRNTCVEVLCAYLRMPTVPPGPADQEVRRSIVRIVRDHLQKGSVPSWSTLPLNFEGAQFSSADFRGVEFRAPVSFDRARFEGPETLFDGAVFGTTRITFEGAAFPQGTVSFVEAAFHGTHRPATWRDAGFAGRLTSHGIYHLKTGPQAFGGAIHAGSRPVTGVSFFKAKFCGAVINFTGAAFLGGVVTFSKAEVSAGRIDFAFAEFCGSDVDFGSCQIEGGVVDFSKAELDDNINNRPNVARPTPEGVILWGTVTGDG